MARLETRLKKHRSQEKLKKRLAALYSKTGSLAVALLLFYTLLQLPATYAFFASQAETSAENFRATSFADNLKIYPGKTMTNNSPGEPGPAFPVAQVVHEDIYLDFGTYPTANRRNFPSILVLKNISQRTLALNWNFSAELENFFVTEEGSIVLGPGEQYTLGVKLRGSEATPGEFAGMLQLTALNGFVSRELPARLRLVAGGNKQALVADEQENKDTEHVDFKDQDRQNDKNEEEQQSESAVTGFVYLDNAAVEVSEQDFEDAPREAGNNIIKEQTIEKVPNNTEVENIGKYDN